MALKQTITANHKWFLIILPAEEFELNPTQCTTHYHCITMEHISVYFY